MKVSVGLLSSDRFSLSLSQLWLGVEKRDKTLETNYIGANEASNILEIRMTPQFVAIFHAFHAYHEGENRKAIDFAWRRPIKAESIYWTNSSRILLFLLTLRFWLSVCDKEMFSKNDN